MLELLLQSGMGNNPASQSAAGPESSTGNAKENFAGVLGEQVLALPIQALLADAVQEAQPQTQQAGVMTDLAQTADSAMGAMEADPEQDLVQQITAQLPEKDVLQSALPTAEIILPPGVSEAMAAGKNPVAHPAVADQSEADPTVLQTLAVTDQAEPPIESSEAPVERTLEVGAQNHKPQSQATPNQTQSGWPELTPMAPQPEPVLATLAVEGAGSAGEASVSSARPEAGMAAAAAAGADKSTAANLRSLPSDGAALNPAEAAELPADAIETEQALPAAELRNKAAVVAPQALPASATTPLLQGVIEQSSGLAVSSLESLESAESSLLQSQTANGNRVAVNDVAAHAMAIIRQRGHDQGDARLALHPAELGQLDLKIEQDGQRLDISVLVDSEQARSAVTDQLNQLRERLAESGMRLANLDINLRDQNERQNNDGEQTAHGSGAEEAVNNPAQRTTIISENALDLYA